MTDVERHPKAFEEAVCQPGPDDECRVHPMCELTRRVFSRRWQSFAVAAELYLAADERPSSGKYPPDWAAKRRAAREELKRQLR